MMKCPLEGVFVQFVSGLAETGDRWFFAPGTNCRDLYECSTFRVGDPPRVNFLSGAFNLLRMSELLF